MSLTFVERSTLGEGWTFEVRRSGLPVGRILKNAAGAYHFIEGMHNMGLNPQDQDTDLERLKERLRQKYT